MEKCREDGLKRRVEKVSKVVRERERMLEMRAEGLFLIGLG